VIADGKVIGHGTPEDLMNSDEPNIKQFLHGQPDGPVPFHYPANDYLADLLGDLIASEHTVSKTTAGGAR
jgi:phospholipid/cholesterol/gamma-HCH transport system ATP-binding protein